MADMIWRTMVPVCLLVAWVLGAAAKSCEPHFSWTQTERHDRRLMALLDPIHDSALTLYRENPHSREAALFAHRLLRVYTNFSTACYDHHWTAALTHKLCASFVRASTWLQDPAVGFCAHAAGAHSHSSHCVCNGLSYLLLACTHHVQPWAADDPFCHHIGPCAHAHPFAGFCQLYHTGQPPSGRRRQVLS